MIRCILFAFLLAACGAAQQLSCPPPSQVTIIQRDTISQDDTIRITTVVQNTVVDTLTRLIVSDTTVRYIGIAPSPTGDNWQMIQDAIDYGQTHPAFAHIRLLDPGAYPISRTLMIAKRTATGYGQAHITIEGPTPSKNAPGAFMATIMPMFTNGPAIIIQQGKSCLIKNVAIVGKYTKASGFTQAQVDTTKWKDWEDGVCTAGPTNPYAGIAIDPFSDPAYFDGAIHRMYEGLESWYIPGMSKSGSTDIHIKNCAIVNFIVGIVQGPSQQQNCEEIVEEDLRVEACRSVIAFTQAQQKENQVIRLHVWAAVHTVFDGANYGFGHGDGATAPIVHGANLAGSVYQLYNCNSMVFPVSGEDIYAESLFKIGTAGGWAGTHFTNFQIDFQADPGIPAPDFLYQGTNTIWDNCQLRRYNGVLPGERMVFNSSANLFIGGNISMEPVISPLTFVGGAVSVTPQFQMVSIYYGSNVLFSGGYDSAGAKINTTILDDGDFTAHFQGTGGELVGDLILTQRPFWDEWSALIGVAVPVGYVTRLDGNTVYVKNLGLGIQNGDQLKIWAAKFKAGFIP